MIRAAPLFLVVPLAMLLSGIATGRADTIGWQIEARACLGATCRTLPASPSLWRGRYACAGRAAHLEAVAAGLPPALFGLPPGPWRITARCLDVDGIPSA